MRSLHKTEASPGAWSTQGTKRGGKRRRTADSSTTSKKQPKAKACEAPRFLGDGEDGDDELLLKDDKKGKSKETVPDEKEIEAFLADASSEEESTQERKEASNPSLRSPRSRRKRWVMSALSEHVPHLVL
jgi:hypothetical protein